MGWLTARVSAKPCPAGSSCRSRCSTATSFRPTRPSTSSHQVHQGCDEGGSAVAHPAGCLEWVGCGTPGGLPTQLARTACTRRDRRHTMNLARCCCRIALQPGARSWRLVAATAFRDRRRTV